MADYAHNLTTAQIERMQKRLAREYRTAHKEVAEKFKKYMESFAEKEKAKQALVRAGKMTTKEFKQWRIGQMAVGERWEKMRDVLAAEYTKANAAARGMIKGDLPSVYALHHNYAAYQIEHGARIQTGFTLYDQTTVQRLAAKNPKLLPDPDPESKTAQRIIANKDARWNRSRIQSQLMQGIMQGEDIPSISRRMKPITENNMMMATRTARTAMTGAQNAGRLDAYKEAEDMGIHLKKRWEAILDEHTRASHAQMHGETVDVNDKFSNKLDAPGDPSGDPAEVYNCRCTMTTQIEGFERELVTSSARLEELDMSFDEWKDMKIRNSKVKKWKANRGK